MIYLREVLVGLAVTALAALSAMDPTDAVHFHYYFASVLTLVWLLLPEEGR